MAMQSFICLVQLFRDVATDGYPQKWMALASMNSPGGRGGIRQKCWAWPNGCRTCGATEIGAIAFGLTAWSFTLPSVPIAGCTTAMAHPASFRAWTTIYNQNLNAEPTFYL